MPHILIPERVLPGFKEISDLSKEQAKQFASYLNSVHVRINFDEFFDDINEYLFSELNIKSSKKIVEALISLTDLLEPTDIDLKDLAAQLAESFEEVSPTKLSEEQMDSLRANLFLIFEKSQNLRLTLKAITLAYESDNIYRESKVISDVRFIFNDELKDKNRNAMILHRLHIVIKNNNRNH